jgi:hypothetical protein
MQVTELLVSEILPRPDHVPDAAHPVMNLDRWSSAKRASRPLFPALRADAPPHEVVEVTLALLPAPGVLALIVASLELLNPAHD